ncbi:M50 family metallopeptidase [Pseudonocardia sp.]|uniref:M50 family metallopeptidase n=1 Tax=Pseudonocardia sp. TaxID=60912 RepID=UPI003D139C5C
MELLTDLPVAWVTGVVVALAVLFTGSWAGALVTVAHEGGHVAVAALTGRRPAGFRVHEGVGGGVTRFAGSWGPGLVFVYLAGYVTPPLLGLGGAWLVLDGRAWVVLWGAVLLLAGVLFLAETAFTWVLVVLAGAGIGWAALRGAPDVRDLLATGLVWLMLLGGVWSLRGQGWGRRGSDAAQLAANTLVPRAFWVLAFWGVALGCLWFGGRALLEL